MSVRVMLASSSRDVMERLSTVVDEVADLSLAGRASSSNAVPTLLRRSEADVVVIDEELGPMMALDLVRDISSRFAYVAVVVVGRNDDVESLRSAVDAGARGLVLYQMSFEEIAARLRAASTWAASMRALVEAERSGKTEIDTGALIAVNGAKGGVGVTTIATRLALDAARSGRSVCLIDLDLQNGDIGFMLDIEHHRAITDLVGVSDESGMALEDSLYAHPSGLRVLLAPGDGERGEDIDREVARAVLSRVRSVFDLVIVDCGSVMTEASAVALSMAEHAVIVATPDVVALRASRRLTELWSRLEVRNSRDCTVLLNKVSKNNEVQPRTAERISGLPHLTTTVPAAFRKLEEGVNTTTPDRIDDRVLRRAFTLLAQELFVSAPPSVRRSDTVSAVDAGRGSARPASRWRRLLPTGTRGSAPVLEAAALAPIAVLVVGLLTQMAFLGYTYVVAGEAANRASRALAVGETVERAEDAALAVVPAGWRGDGVVIDVPRGDGGEANGDALVTVTLSVPLLGFVLPTPLTATGTAAWGEE